MFGRQYEAVIARYPDLGERRLVHETIRRMINHIVVDLIRTTQAQLEAAAAGLDRRGARPGEAARNAERGLPGGASGAQGFLREHVYRHYKVLRMTAKARRVSSELFDAFFKDVTSHAPGAPRAGRCSAEAARGPAGRARAVADYIAGMTDRYAILEHRRLFEPGERT